MQNSIVNVNENKQLENGFRIAPVQIWNLINKENGLKPMEAIIYMEISALCQNKEFGYCWASNDYFAEKFNTKSDTVSRWISRLVKLGHIARELIYNEDGSIKQRKLFVTTGKTFAEASEILDTQTKQAQVFKQRAEKAELKRKETREAKSEETEVEPLKDLNPIGGVKDLNPIPLKEIDAEPLKDLNPIPIGFKSEDKNINNNNIKKDKNINLEDNNLSQESSSKTDDKEYLIWNGEKIEREKWLEKYTDDLIDQFIETKDNIRDKEAYKKTLVKDFKQRKMTNDDICDELEAKIKEHYHIHGWETRESKADPDDYYDWMSEI